VSTGTYNRRSLNESTLVDELQ